MFKFPINLSSPHGKFDFLDAQLQKYHHLRLTMEDSLYVHRHFSFNPMLWSSDFKNFWLYSGTKQKRGCDIIEAALRTHLILPQGRSDCSDIKLVLLRREALLVREMADTSLTSLSDDLAETLSQLLY